MTIHVLLVDDHRIVREGIRSLIDVADDMCVVGEAEDGRSTVEQGMKLNPDVIIIDICMKGLNGIDATRKLRLKNNDAKVIALSMYSDERFVAGMFEAGACGYLLKDCATKELCDAIRKANKGEIYLSQQITNIVINDYIDHLHAPHLLYKPELTCKEREILQLLTKGNLTREIAHTLDVSVKTIETHRSHIMEKLQLHSIAELTKYAIKEGLTSLDP